MTVAPSYAASSGECSWSWAVRPQLVELSDEVGGVFEVGGWLPGWCIIALPLDEVLQAVVVEAAVHDGLDLPLFLTINNDGRWWWRNLSWVWVADGMFQERDMENWVVLDRGWEA